MPVVTPVRSSEHIKCSTEDGAGIAGTWTHECAYLLHPVDTETTRLENGDIEVRLDRAAVLRLPVGHEPQTEIEVRYQLVPGEFAPLESIVVDDSLLENDSIPLDRVLDFGYLERQFQDRTDYQFAVYVTMRQPVDLAAMRARGIIEEQRSGNASGRSIRIINHLAPRNVVNEVLPLVNYTTIIGNLDDEIVREVSMFAGTRVQSWQLTVDRIACPFTRDSLRSRVEQALEVQRLPVLERVPAFFRQFYGASASEPLSVKVVVAQVEPSEPCLIHVSLVDPAGDLYYKTGIPEVDKCLRDVSRWLFSHGVAVGTGGYAYQRVLAQLLIYRHKCGCVPGYIDASIASKPEIEGFHAHLTGRLPHEISVVPVAVVSEAELGNSRVDLLMDGVPVELKLEDRKTATTDDTVRRYSGQAADYVGRQSSPFGFLVVLDTVLDRALPTCPVNQDLRLREIQTVSGDSVLLVSLVARIPRAASEHSRLPPAGP